MPKATPQNNKHSSLGKPQGRRQQQDSEFDQKLLDVARVARVTAGGRRFSFRVVVVIGDKAGRVGVGVKKGKDVQIAIGKAVRDAKKRLITATMTKEGTIPHEAYGKSTSAVIFLKPASPGRGIIAGGAVRVVCDLAGYKDIVGKMISRTNNKLNNARATIKALESISRRPPRGAEKKMSKKKKEIKKPRGQKNLQDVTKKKKESKLSVTKKQSSNNSQTSKHQ